MLKLIAFLKTPKSELTPISSDIELPKPPSLKATPDQINNFREEFDLWESRKKEVLKENTLRFETAFEGIKLCAFLHGFMDPFAFRVRVESHYKWCPKKDWDFQAVRYEMTQ